MAFLRSTNALPTTLNIALCIRVLAVALGLHVALGVADAWVFSHSVAFADDANAAEAEVGDENAANAEVDGNAYTVETLDTIFDYVRTKSARTRKFTGAGELISGAVLVTGGLVRVLRKTNSDNNEYMRGVGAFLTIIGSSRIGHATVNLVRARADERLADEWFARRTRDEIDEPSMYQFAGAAEAIVRAHRRERRVRLGFSIGRAVAGATILALTPVPDLNKTSRRSGYIVGGLYTATGLLGIVVALRPSTIEKIWASKREQLRIKPLFAYVRGQTVVGIAASGSL